jgi:GntR family transcriptional regulator/MocR family aminotransferase
MLRQDLYRRVRSSILDGRLLPGEPLPSTRALARELGVSRNTVLHAYEQLAAEGFLEGRAGGGTRVRADVVATSRRRAPAGKVLAPRAVFERLEPVPPEVPGRWDFRLGTPDPSLFPYDEWRRLIARQLRRRPKSADYLPPEGDPGAREAIAHAVGLSRSVRAAADDLLITCGAQQAIDLVARVLVEPGAIVAMEDPGYLPARQLFELHGARVVAVPVDADGLDVAKLPSQAKLVYVTPSHQFPLGVSMSLARRQALLAWSERTGAAILEDDYDSEFRYDGRPLEPLQSLDRRGRVVYVGTFSKVLLPRLRLGFVVAPQSLMPALRTAKARLDWHTAPEPQRALAEFMRDGLFARHVRHLTRIYGERHERLRDAIQRSFRSRATIHPSAAGLHLSIALSAPIALPPGVSAQPLPDNRLSLGFGLIDARDIAEGVRKLARA